MDYKESWAPKNWCFWTVMLEKTLESHLDCKEIQPVHPKGDQSWVFIGRTDVEAETPILWPPDVKNWFTGKDRDPGKDWRQEEKGMAEDEIVGWHQQLDGHEFEQAPGVGDREAWCAAVHGVTKSWTLLSNWTDWLTDDLTAMNSPTLSSWSILPYAFQAGSYKCLCNLRSLSWRSCYLALICFHHLILQTWACWQIWIESMSSFFHWRKSSHSPSSKIELIFKGKSTNAKIDSISPAPV